MPNELAAEQCGGILEVGIRRVCKLKTNAKEITSKTRTAAASGALGARHFLIEHITKHKTL